MGLSRLEIEAIKARGVSQLLVHAEQRCARPPRRIWPSRRHA